MNPNLVYNGDFHKGTESWSGTGITACSEGGVTLTGDLHQYNYFIPVSSSRRYKLTYDLKMNTTDGSHNFYIALYPYDSNRQFISCPHTFKRANSMTTLASDLKSGDTTVSLTSATGWTTGYVGICDSKAYGETRATKYYKFNSISGTTVTLKSAYSGATIPSGTKVCNTYDSSTYYYPHSLTYANLPTTWTTYSVEFNGGNSIRQSCVYFVIHTLGYQHKYSIRNLRIECISDYQDSSFVDSGNAKPQLFKSGTFNALSFSNVGMKIRYIRDIIHGNTVNTSNHWNEIKVINEVGENIALAHNVTVGTSVKANSIITDGIVDSQLVGATDTTLMLDLGFAENVYQIIIWHYYPDGRTYTNNVTEVSLDGTNWIEVYKGQKPETAQGNIINLSPVHMSIIDSGDIYCNDIIEW